MAEAWLTSPLGACASLLPWDCGAVPCSALDTPVSPMQRPLHCFNQSHATPCTPNSSKFDKYLLLSSLILKVSERASRR